MNKENICPNFDCIGQHFWWIPLSPPPDADLVFVLSFVSSAKMQINFYGQLSNLNMIHKQENYFVYYVTYGLIY